MAREQKEAKDLKERSGMPYDVVAYEADDLAMQLTETEEGLFHRMLRRSWMNGSIPADLQALADICRTTRRKLEKAWPRLGPLWHESPDLPGRLINAKQEQERIFVEEKRKRATESAKNRWGKRNKTLNNADANALPTQSERNAFPIPYSHIPPIGPPNGNGSTGETGYSLEFEKFWEVYPKHVGKGAAFKAWKRIHPSKTLQDIVLSAIGRQKKSAQWLNENGRYIPNPSTWLSQSRWDDDATGPKTQPTGVVL